MRKASAKRWQKISSEKHRASCSKYNVANVNKLKIYNDAHREECKAYNDAHGEERKTYNDAHREERKAYNQMLIEMSTKLIVMHVHREERNYYVDMKRLQFG